jgi:hypothetical protein
MASAVRPCVVLRPLARLEAICLGAGISTPEQSASGVVPHVWALVACAVCFVGTFAIRDNEICVVMKGPPARQLPHHRSAPSAPQAGEV